MKSAVGWVEGTETHQGWSGGLGFFCRVMAGGPPVHPPYKVLIGIALVLLLLSGCQSQDHPPTHSVELLPLPALPDLDAVDPAAAKQFRQRHRFVVRLLQKDTANAQGQSWAYGQLGKVYHAYRNLDEAQVCYLNAHSLDPREFRWVYYLGHIDRTQGRYATSNTAFERALQLRPDDVPTLVWLAENARDQHQLESATRRFQQALTINPECIKARVGLAQVALEQNEFVQARRLLEEALTAQPDASQIHYTLGLVLRSLGDTQRAASFFDRIPRNTRARIPIAFADPLMQEVSDLRRSAQYHARQGMKAVSQGRFQAAVREFEQSLAANPDRADARHNLAAALLRLGRPHAAREQLNAQVERAPTYTSSRVLLARMLMDEGDFVSAEDHLRHALEVDPDLERGHAVLGDVFRRTGRFEAALESYRRALDRVPELGAARFGVALTFLQQGRFQPALEYLEHSLATLPQSRGLTLLLARLLAATPDPQIRDGQRALTLALAVVSQSTSIAGAETLAMALAELGRFDEAIDWQRSALKELETESEASNEIRQRVQQRLALYERRQPCREPWAETERLAAYRMTR